MAIRNSGVRRLNDSGDLSAVFKRVGVDINDPTLGGVVLPRREALVHAKSIPDTLGMILPNVGGAEINQVIDLVESVIGSYSSYFAGSFVAMQRAMSELPNCAVSLYPAADTDTGIAKNAVTPLVLATNGSSIGGATFFFTEQMWFGRLVTGTIDASVGWRFAANSVRFATDIVSGMPNDVSFLAYQDDIVFSRTPLGVYAQRGFFGASQVPFTASAVHNRTANQIMVDGVALEYRDERCYNSDSYRRSLEYMDGSVGEERFHEIVGRLIGHRARMLQGGSRPLSFGGLGTRA